MSSRKRSAFSRRSRRRGPNDVYTIPAFCLSNAISQSTYYMLKRQGRAPREIVINKRVIITPEAEQDWRREREAETARRRIRDREVAAAINATAAHNATA